MSVQRQDAPSIKVAIPGMSGAGKSTVFEKLILKEKARWIFLYDHKDGDLSRRFKVKPCLDGDDLLAAVERGGFVIFDPCEFSPGDKIKGFHFFSEFVWQVCRKLKGKKVFGSDELDELVDSRTDPGPICTILNQGRTYEIACYFICQSMNVIHNSVRKQMTEIFCFMHGDKNGTDWLEERGFSKESIAGLKHGEWLYSNRNTGEQTKGGTAFKPKNAKRDLRGL